MKNGGATINYWNSVLIKKDLQHNEKSGLHIQVEKTVNPEVRRACLEFAKWLRNEYCFPVRVIIYVKSRDYITMLDGDKAFGTCFRPFSKNDYPYIRLSTGDYPMLAKSDEKDNALVAILHCMAIMLTHYFQWLDDFEDIKNEVKHAEKCASQIIRSYSQTREHP